MIDWYKQANLVDRDKRGIRSNGVLRGAGAPLLGKEEYIKKRGGRGQEYEMASLSRAVPCRLVLMLIEIQWPCRCIRSCNANLHAVPCLLSNPNPINACAFLSLLLL